jgi:hypothetical protein
MPIQAIIKSASLLMTKKNIVHYTVQDFLLHQDVIQAKEGGGAHIKSAYTSSLKLRLGETSKTTLIL